jgi:hypothetical protein
MGEIILPRRQRDKLGVLHDEFIAGDVESYVVIAIKKDGTTEVNFDLHDSMHLPGLNKMGGGLDAAKNHVFKLACEMRDEQEARVLTGLPGGKRLN